jgi:hypothetical protein
MSAIVAKETYYRGKRDLLDIQRRLTMSDVWRHLHSSRLYAGARICIEAKETYDSGKIDLL